MIPRHRVKRPCNLSYRWIVALVIYLLQMLRCSLFSTLRLFRGVEGGRAVGGQDYDEPQTPDCGSYPQLNNHGGDRSSTQSSCTSPT